MTLISIVNGVFYQVLEIPIVYEVPEEGEISPDCQFSLPGSAGSDMLDCDNKKVSKRVLERLVSLTECIIGYTDA